MVTDYVVLALFIYKFYIGLKYLINVIWVGDMDEEFLMDTN